MGAVCCKQEPVDLESEVDLSHFVLLRSVGKGAFGKVRVVEHRGTNQLFALKYINKAKCIKMGAVDNIISERRLLEQINYTFIVNLRYAFQDDENLFMVIDLMLGGDLRFHLDRFGPFPEEYVCFYAAQISLALHNLHQKNIVHRDLKPDNILLNEKGHAHLTDFNIAVRFNPAKPLTSVAGSMAYMAPEILQKRGYTTSVDWWSLGVVCYELLFGKRPFRGKSNELLQKSIMYDPLEFPSQPAISADAKDFISRLLTRDVQQRLPCSSRHLDHIKSHPWMKTLKWDAMEAKQGDGPFVPDSKRANFDPTHELEEILLEDNPLKVRKRAPKRSGPHPNLANTYANGSNDTIVDSPERQKMEEQFLTFDYTKPEENEARNKELERRRNLARNDEKRGTLRAKMGKAKSSSHDLLGQVRGAPDANSTDRGDRPLMASTIVTSSSAASSLTRTQSPLLQQTSVTAK